MTLILRMLALVAALAMLPLAAARAQSDQQTLVDRATLTVQEMLNTPSTSNDVRRILRNARAVMVCPRIFRAGFIIGGSGGGCVLLSRDARGNWSYPAFYSMGSGSVGFQIGIQDSAVVLSILTERGFKAILDSQFKFGGDAGIAIATLGAGVEGATTADLGADIVAFSTSRGLYAGISLQGSILSSRSEWNQAYYGHAYGPRQVVIDMVGRNPGAEPLREVLSRSGMAANPVSGGGGGGQPLPVDQVPSSSSRSIQSEQLGAPRR